MLLAVINQYPDADITLTGHSLGGSLAQSVGAASGFPTYAFNAPGCGYVYESLYEYTLNRLNGLDDDGTNFNYRIYGDQISQIGIPMPNSSTVTLPWPPGFVWNQNANPYVDFIVNFSNGKLLLVHSASTVIAQIGATPVKDLTGQPNDATAIQNAAMSLSVTGELYTFAFELTSGLDRLIDPSGADFVFNVIAGSPALAAIDLPSLSDIASYDVRYEVANIWSAFSLIQPATVYPLGLGANGVEFISLDSNGNPVSVSDLLFDMTFATTGTVNMSLTELPSPPVITTLLGSQTVTAGQPATFSISATGSDPLTYQWAKNGVAISSATATSYTLAITSASDSANYTIAVTDINGYTTSNTYTLAVNTPIPTMPPWMLIALAMLFFTVTAFFLPVKQSKL